MAAAWAQRRHEGKATPASKQQTLKALAKAPKLKDLKTPETPKKQTPPPNRVQHHNTHYPYWEPWTDKKDTTARAIAYTLEDQYHIEPHLAEACSLTRNANNEAPSQYRSKEDWQGYAALACILQTVTDALEGTGTTERVDKAATALGLEQQPIALWALEDASASTMATMTRSKAAALAAEATHHTYNAREAQHWAMDALALAHRRHIDLEEAFEELKEQHARGAELGRHSKALLENANR